MNKNFLMATLAGAAVMFLVGYLLYGVALAGFFESNVGTATGVEKDPPEWAWLVISAILYAGVIAMVLRFAGAKDVANGLKTAAVFGLVLTASINLGQYSMTNLMTLTGALVDPFVGAIHAGLGGAVIGMMLGKGDAS